jgi:hypothetical protein
MFGVAYIKVDVVNGFNLQEIRFLGYRTGRGLGFGYSRSHSASFGWSSPLVSQFVNIWNEIQAKSLLWV